MLHIKLQCVRVVASCCMQNFGNCSHFSEREHLTVNKLSFPNNWNSYGSRSSWRIVVIGSDCLTKNTAVWQKCQQNVSKIAQRHDYRLPSAAIMKNSVNITETQNFRLCQKQASQKYNYSIYLQIYYFQICLSDTYKTLKLAIFSRRSQFSLRKTVGKVSPILVTLTSRSDSDIESSNVSRKENKPDGVNPNSNDTDYYVRKNERKIQWFSADWIDDTTKGGLTQFWELFTAILYLLRDCKR